MKLLLNPLYKRTSTFGEPIEPTFRGVEKSMSSSDFIPVENNCTYLLMLVPSTLVKEGGWYSAEFEPVIVCQNNKDFSSQFVDDVVKKILSYLHHTDMHYVVSLGDNPKSDANVKVVVELNQSKATQTNISLRFTTNTPLAGAEDLLTSHPENFAFSLIPHTGEMLGHWSHFSNMFLTDLNKSTTDPHNGSIGSEKLRQLRFDSKTMSLWLEFCDGLSTDMVVNPTVDVKQTFLDMVIRSLESSIRTSNEDPESSAFFTKNPASQLQRFGRLPSPNEAYITGVEVAVNRGLSPFENLFDSKESLQGHYRDPNTVQVIEVNYGVIVSDSLNHLVGLKINLESGTWTRHTDGGDWIKD